MLRRTLLLAPAALDLAAQTKTDRGVGKWRFLPAVSTYESGPAPRESRRQWIPDGDRVRFLHDGISSDGKPFHTEFTAGYDGLSNPFVGGTLYNSVALRLRSPSRVDQVFRKDGVVTVKATRTISADGKRMTIDSRGTLPTGKRFRNLLVYERE